MATLGNGQALIKGLLKEIREIKRNDNSSFYEHLILEPAKDEYSHPRSFPICAEEILGARGQVITVTAEIFTRQSKGFYNLRLWAVQGE